MMVTSSSTPAGTWRGCSLEWLMLGRIPSELATASRDALGNPADVGDEGVERRLVERRETADIEDYADATVRSSNGT